MLGKEEMFSAGETLKRYWLRHGIKLKQGASEDELAAFEAEYHVRLPEDVREYFSAVNGFDGSEHWMTDENVITFLALNEMKPLSEAWSPKIVDAASYFVFADYSLSAHIYAIRLSNDSENDNPVVVAYDEENLVKVASSFSEFVQGYIEDDKAVLFPETQV
jgi:SMI1 / KNR4 family (SUKH-1)